MCATKTCSKFHCSSIHDLESFKWTELFNDMKINAPTLTSILNACTGTKKFKGNRTAIICVCAGILFKFHFSQMNLFQKIVSLILHAGHCGKMVCQSYSLASEVRIHVYMIASMY